jgi:DNA ligase-1
LKDFVTAISTAEKISTKVDKHAALSGMSGDDLRLVWEANNPYRVFNVRKWDEPVYANHDPLDHSRFFTLLDALHSRTITGNDARASVSAVLGEYTEHTASYLERVLLKDLKCGASGETFGKIYPTLKIPSFEVMLAGKVDEKYKWFFPVLAESKYDGNRLVAFIKADRSTPVEYFSRGGRPSDYCAGLFDEELFKMAEHWGCDLCVDGEVLANSFQETMNARGSKGDAAKANLKFFAFDIIRRHDWETNNGANAAQQTTRSAALEATIRKLDLKKVIKSKYKICKDMPELQAFYAEVLEEGKNSDGTLNGLGEGLILKNPKGEYEWKRSKNWMKWKPVIDLDLEIVGFYEGEGRLKGTLGGLELSGKNENDDPVEARCGSGFSDDMRNMIWKNRQKFLGKIAMIECQEISLAQDSKVYSARFPIFIRIRDDK